MDCAIEASGIHFGYNKKLILNVSADNQEWKEIAGSL